MGTHLTKACKTLRRRCSEALLLNNLSRAEHIALLIYFAPFFLDLQLGKCYNY